MPLQEGEGPVGIVICPSRELARQTHAITVQHAAALAAAGWPETRHLLCVGGEDTRSAGPLLCAPENYSILLCYPETCVLVAGLESYDDPNELISFRHCYESLERPDSAQYADAVEIVAVARICAL